MRKVQHYHRHSQLRVIAMIGHYATSWSSVIGDCCLFGYRPYVAIMNTKSMGLCTKGYPPEHGSDTETNVMDNRDFAIFVFKMSSGRIYYIALRPTPPGSWWRHQMETFSALLALCVGNSPVTGKFTTQRPATRSFDVFFDLRLNKRLSKQSWGWWLETPSCSLWRQCNVYAYQEFEI